MSRIIGWEDEFRITDGSRVLTLDELLKSSPRDFFAQDKHTLISERKSSPFQESIDIADYDSARTDCVWTWYGGKVYDEQDSLVEASTPPVSLRNYPIDDLIRMITVGRAQIGELAQGMRSQGVSSQLNIMLDSNLEGEDLCDENKYIDRNVPTQGLTMGKAHKLGCDISRIMVRTVGPVIAYIFFNSAQRKGAIYRPRGHKRLELALPFVPRHDQVMAGSLFWFAAVEHATRVLKEDLLSFGEDFPEKFRDPEYYQRVLETFPLRIEGVRLKNNVSFRLGFEVAGGYEDAVLEDGSDAEVETNRGKMSVRQLLLEYTSFFREELMRWGTTQQRAALEEYALGLRAPSVDLKRQHSHFILSNYLQANVKDGPSNFLNRLSIRHESYPISILVKEPTRTIGQDWGDLIVKRNLCDDQDWHRASMEIVVEDYAKGVLRSMRLEVDREHLNSYLRMERQATDPKQFLKEILPYKRGEREYPIPDSIFVYGTFLSDQVVHGLHKGRIISRVDAQARGTLYNLRDFPVLIESYYDVTPVVGQLMRVEGIREFLRASDRYEGADKRLPLFIRAVREVVLADESKTLAWIYLGNANHSVIRSRLSKNNVVPGGRWQPVSVV